MNYRNFFKLFLASVLLLTGAACVKKSDIFGNVNAAPTVKTDAERAVEAAQKVFVQMKEAGILMSAGPCLANEIIPDWVADVVHNPRQAIDNLPANQCSTYLEGKAHHFVELDTEGNLIRAK